MGRRDAKGRGLNQMTPHGIEPAMPAPEGAEAPASDADTDASN